MRKKRGVLYSLSSLGLSLVAFTFSTYVGFFYIDHVGLPPRWVGWGMFAFSWWNAFNDPLLGVLSDRTRTRWGRRIPYIAVAALPLGLAFALLWQPPAFSRMSAVFAWFLALTFLYDGAYSLIHLNVSALFAEMFVTLQERARVSAWRQWFSALGLLIGSAVTPILTARWGWPRMGLAYASTTVGTLFLSLLGSVEVPAYSRLGTFPFVQTVLVALRNLPFLLYLGMLFGTRMGFTLVVAVMPFYAKYNLRSGEQSLTWLMGVPVLTALVLMPLWRHITAFLGARRSLLLATVMTVVGLTPLAFTASLRHALAALFVVGGSMGGVLIASDILLADIIDFDFVLHGKRREGIFVGISNFVTRLPNPVQALLVGEVLARTGYVAGVLEQKGTTVWGLRALTGGIPAAAMVVVALLALWYPLDGARLAEIKAASHALRLEVESKS